MTSPAVTVLSGAAESSRLQITGTLQAIHLPAAQITVTDGERGIMDPVPSFPITASQFQLPPPSSIPNPSAWLSSLLEPSLLRSTFQPHPFHPRRTEKKHAPGWVQESGQRQVRAKPGFEWGPFWVAREEVEDIGQTACGIWGES